MSKKFIKTLARYSFTTLYVMAVWVLIDIGVRFWVAVLAVSVYTGLAVIAVAIGEVLENE